MSLFPLQALPHKISKTTQHYQREVLCKTRSWWWDHSSATDIAPVFIIGCSRAGTTLLYKLLSQTHCLGTLDRETHDFWDSLHPLATRNWSTHALGSQYASIAVQRHIARYFYAHTGKRNFVDKNNQNGLCVDFLHALFPKARFIYVKRNPGDNIHSLMEGWHRPEKYATWSQALPALVHIDEGAIFRWCFFLPEGWRDYLQAPLEDVCAFQYQSINRAILQAKQQIPANQWFELNYEQLITQPQKQLSQLFSALDIIFDHQLEAACQQAMDKPYDVFSPIKCDKWRTLRFAKRIANVLPELTSLAEQMGYSEKQLSYPQADSGQQVCS